jgi:tetratricopeptide (TPR) repeat protein
MTRPAATALLLAAVLLGHANGLAGSFQFDDFNVIVFNPVVHALHAWWADLGHGIRPLLKLSYTLNWIASPDPLGFHLVNLAVHGANTLLVFRLARLSAEEWGEPVARQTTGAAVLAALLFALHPAQTEAVAYVSGRSSSLMALFYLGAVVAYVEGTLRAQRRWIVPAALLACLALLTKETAVTFPLALLLWEETRKEPPRWREVARRQAVLWLLVALVALAWLLPVYGARVLPDLDPAVVYRNLTTQVEAIAYLVRRLVVVYPLDIDPDLRAVTAWSPALAAHAVLLAGLLPLALWARRRRPWWTFAILWFLVQLAPTNFVLPRLDLANDRQLYLAGVGVWIALGVEAGRVQALLAPRRRGSATGVVAFVIVLLAGLTVLRNRDYANPIRLWEQTAHVSPHKARVHNNLGFAYGAAGCLDQAEAAYKEALRLDPSYTLAQENLLALLQRSLSEPVFRCERGGAVRTPLPR